MHTVRLIVADSTPLLRRLIAECLGHEADIDVVGEAESGRAALELAEKLHPAVVLLRLELADMNGADVAEQIRARLPQTQVVLLTAHPQLASLSRWCGAADCLDLDCTPREILNTVRRLAHGSGSSPLPDAPRTPAVPATVPPKDAAARRADAVAKLFTLANLSPRECAVVEKMVLTEETVAQIARTLSRETNDKYTESAVKHALERALSKMSIEPRTRTALLRRVLDAPSPVQNG